MQPDTQSSPILIIGAGPAGLAIAGRLRKAGLEFDIIEKGHAVGERWHHHYDRLHLHTVNKWSHLPHLPFPNDYPRYVPRQKLVDYFEQYATHFNIRPEFDTEVTRIQKASGGTWEVITHNGVRYAQHIVIATGINRIPNRPIWNGMETFGGTITHSIDYKNPDPFRGSSVLVIGMGNTGAEIALDLSEAGIPVCISLRGSVNIVPRDLNGRPVQETSKLLAKFPFGIGDWLGAKVQRVYFGDLSKYGVKQSTMYPAVELRVTGKSPMIDIGTVKAIKEGRIQVVPGVKTFTKDGVVLDTDQHLKCDHVILATGYRGQLQDLIDHVRPFLDKHDYPKNPIGAGDLNGMYFVGFDNYKLGGILGVINTDSEVIVNHLVKATRKI